MNDENKKYIPKIGEEMYLSRRTGDYYCDIVKKPYTVIEVNENSLIIQEAKLIAPVYHCIGNPMLDRPDLEGQRVFFYDTVAESIEADPNGKKKYLFWNARIGEWTDTLSGRDKYPYIGFFGEGYQHQPYLN